METALILPKLETVFEDVFKQEIKLDRSTSSKDINNWDSLNHIILIKKIEETFNIEFDLFDVIEMKNVGDIIDYIHKQLDGNN